LAPFSRGLGVFPPCGLNVFPALHSEFASGPVRAPAFYLARAGGAR
jgi:hypothetical protein